MASFCERATERKALEALVENQCSRQRARRSRAAGHAQRDPDQHAVQRDAQLQHLRTGPRGGYDDVML